MQLVMVRRRLRSITDAVPVAERACLSTARAPWCSAPSTQRRPSLQLVKVGRRQGSTTDVAHRGWARLLIDRMDTGLVQRPKYPETPEPALGSIKAFSQDDEASLLIDRTDTLVQRPEYPETPELAASEVGAAARLDHRRCPPWLGAPAHRPHGHPGLVQRPEYPETPEPALGSTKASSQDDEVPLGKPTATTCCGCS